MTTIAYDPSPTLRRVLATLLAFFAIFSLTSPVAHADGEDVEATVYIAKNDANISSIVNQANRKVGVDILDYNGKTGVVSFSFQKYRKLADPSVFMESALSATSSSGLGSQRKSKLYNFIAKQDGDVSGAISQLTTDASADFYTAASWLKPFSGPVSTFLGVLCIVLTALFGISMVVDLSFISLPFLRASITERDSGFFSRIVSSDARIAVQMEDTEGKMAIAVWLRKRLVAFVLLGLVIGYLAMGTLYDVIGSILGAFGIH